MTCFIYPIFNVEDSSYIGCLVVSFAIIKIFSYLAIMFTGLLAFLLL